MGLNSNEKLFEIGFVDILQDRCVRNIVEINMFPKILEKPLQMRNNRLKFGL
jgi:hypothetical protein